MAQLLMMMMPWERPMGEFRCRFKAAGRKLGKGELHITRTPYPRAPKEDMPRIVFTGEDSLEFMIPSWRVARWSKTGRHEFWFDWNDSDGGEYRAEVKLERGPDGRRGLADDALNCVFHSVHRFGLQSMGWVDDGSGGLVNVFFRDGRLVIPWLRGTGAEAVPEHWPWDAELYAEMEKEFDAETFANVLNNSVARCVQTSLFNPCPTAPNGVLARIAHYAQDQPGEEIPAYPWADGIVTEKWIRKIGFVPEMVYPDIMGWINSTYVLRLPMEEGKDGKMVPKLVQVPPAFGGRSHHQIWQYADIRNDYKRLELYETVRLWWARYTTGDWWGDKGLLPDPVKTGTEMAIKRLEKRIAEREKRYADHRARMGQVPDPEGTVYVDPEGKPSKNGMMWSQKGAAMWDVIRGLKRCLEIVRGEVGTFRYYHHADDRFNELDRKLAVLFGRVGRNGAANPTNYVVVNGRMQLNLMTDIDEYMLSTRIVPEADRAVADITRHRDGIPDPSPY